MMHQTKWIGLSLALHLTAAAGMTVVAARNAERPPKAIMVMLDKLDSPDRPQSAARQAQIRAIERPVIRNTPLATRPETTKSEPVARTLQPVMPSRISTNQPPGQNQTRIVPKDSPVADPAVPSRPTPVNVTPQPAQTTASGGQSVAQRTQQRYLKEHFIYIRNLITQQLVYPPMARKMGWSGKVVVAFVIAEDGAVHNIRVVESSGFSILDRSAVETVRTTAPFPNPPVRAEIIVPIYFQLMQ